MMKTTKSCHIKIAKILAVLYFMRNPNSRIHKEMKRSKGETRIRIQQDEEEHANAAGIRLYTGVHVNRIRKRSGYSIIAKDRTNKLLLVWAAAEERDAELKMEEASVIKIALMLARSKNWQNVNAYGSNNVLIQKMRMQEENDSRCATILGNVSLLSSLFCTCSFKFINSKANVAANRIAQYAVGLKSAVKWEDNFPKWVQDNTNKL